MFDNFWLLGSGLVIGTVGLGLLIYGKQREDFRCFAGGLVLSVFPYFVHSLLVMWLLAAGCGAGLYLWRRAS